MSEHDPSAEVLVRELEARARSFATVADSLNDEDSAAVLREEAVQLWCHAAVVFALSELHDEMGRQTRWWDQFVQRMSKNTYGETQ